MISFLRQSWNSSLVKLNTSNPGRVEFCFLDAHSESTTPQAWVLGEHQLCRFPLSYAYYSFFGYAYELHLNSYPLKMPFESLRFQLRLWLQHLFEKTSHVYIWISLNIRADPWFLPSSASTQLNSTSTSIEAEIVLFSVHTATHPTSGKVAKWKYFN